MGLFKNNYMFSKVTNYSFILNEHQTEQQKWSWSESDITRKHTHTHTNIVFKTWITV